MQQTHACLYGHSKWVSVLPAVTDFQPSLLLADVRLMSTIWRGLGAATGLALQEQQQLVLGTAHTC